MTESQPSKKTAKLDENTEKIDEKSKNNEAFDTQESSNKKETREETFQKLQESWGNAKVLVFLVGTLILVALSAVFFGVRMTNSALFDATTLTICKVMFGICVVAFAVVLAFLIMSAVLLAKRSKKD